MVIEGNEYLIDDSYKNIKIKDKEIAFDNGTSKIRSRLDYELKNETIYEIIMKTVDGFLWNNTINYISDNEIMSTSNKKLSFNTSFDNVIRMKVKDKYLIDRTYHLCHSEATTSMVHASNKISSYDNNDYTIRLRNGEITYEELVFLTKLLDNTFNDEPVGLRFADNKLFISNIRYEGKYIVFKNIKANDMTYAVCEVVSYHNKKIFDNNLNRKLKKEMK